MSAILGKCISPWEKVRKSDASHRQEGSQVETRAAGRFPTPKVTSLWRTVMPS